MRRSEAGKDTHAGFLFDWERLVLAARFSATTKLVAFAMRTFADPDGTRVRPGTARLCVLCDVSYSSVLRARRELQRVGLLELARRGNRRKGRANEYRLILAEDLYERLTWLSPSEIDAQAEHVAEHRQAVEAARLRDRKSGVTQTPETETDQVSQVILNGASGVTDDRDQVSHRHPTNPLDQSTTTKTRPKTVVPSAGDPPPARVRAREKKIKNGKEEEKNKSKDDPAPRADNQPACPRCGTTLDPDGTCFMCG